MCCAAYQCDASKVESETWESSTPTFFAEISFQSLPSSARLEDSCALTMEEANVKSRHTTAKPRDRWHFMSRPPFYRMAFSRTTISAPVESVADRGPRSGIRTAACQM